MKITCVTLCLAFATASGLVADNNAVVANVGTIAFGNVEVSYERKIAQSFSIATVATYYDARWAPVKVFSYGYLFGLGTMFKFHPWGEALKNGVYLAPYLKLGYLSHPARGDMPADHNILARIGGLIGWTYVFDVGLVIDLGWGLENYQFFSLDKSPREFQDPQKTMFRPMFVANVGFGF